MTSLKRAEHIYRTRLANEPVDSDTRIKLAWCLFMQALYRAGQESMLNALAPISEGEPLQKSLHPRCIWDQDADDLIQDCLSQTGTVMQLSADPQHLSDLQRLQTLLRTFGCEMAVSQSRENTSRRLSEMLHDIL